MFLVLDAKHSNDKGTVSPPFRLEPLEPSAETMGFFLGIDGRPGLHRIDVKIPSYASYTGPPVYVAFSVVAEPGIPNGNGTGQPGTTASASIYDGRTGLKGAIHFPQATRIRTTALFAVDRPEGPGALSSDMILGAFLDQVAPPGISKGSPWTMRWMLIDAQNIAWVSDAELGIEASPTKENQVIISPAVGSMTWLPADFSGPNLVFEPSTTPDRQPDLTSLRGCGLYLASNAAALTNALFFINLTYLAAGPAAEVSAGAQRSREIVMKTVATLQARASRPSASVSPQSPAQPALPPSTPPPAQPQAMSTPSAAQPAAPQPNPAKTPPTLYESSPQRSFSTLFLVLLILSGLALAGLAARVYWSSRNG